MNEHSTSSLDRLTNHRKRFFKLAGMTVNVAGSYAHNQLKRALRFGPANDADLAHLYHRIGEQVAATLGELKGAAMKAGQIASQTKGLLPVEITTALERLQKAAPPMPFNVIRAQLQAELGVTAEKRFAWINETPFAAASIGQVHRARTKDGRNAIIKVQYPGVADSCDSDLKHLKTLLRLGRLIDIDDRVLDRLFEEVRARISEELDYVNEADNVRCFQRFHQDDEGVVIPAVIDELSAQRVLTLTYEPGDALNAVKPPRYSQAAINELGQRLYRTVLKQLLLLQAVHGDPQPGNFAFRPDGSIVIYDFGCVKKLRPEIVSAYRDAIAAFLDADYAKLDRALIALGARVADGPPVTADYYAQWRDILIRPFGPEPFDFGASTLHEELMQQTPDVLKRLDSFQPAVDTVYVDRVMGGHYWNLLNLGVKTSLLPDIQQLLGCESNAA